MGNRKQTLSSMPLFIFAISIISSLALKQPHTSNICYISWSIFSILNFQDLVLRIVKDNESPKGVAEIDWWSDWKKNTYSIWLNKWVVFRIFPSLLNTNWSLVENRIIYNARWLGKSILCFLSHFTLSSISLKH